MVDMIAAAPTTGGITSPLLIQAQQNDPRLALARAMLANTNNDRTPLYTPAATIGKALQEALAGFTNIKLGQDYLDRQKSLGDTFNAALDAGENGIQPSVDPTTGQPTGKAIGPGYEALASVLTKSSDPVAQQMGLEFAVKGMATKQAARINFLQELAKKGLTVEPGTGNIIHLPKYGDALADITRKTSAAKAGGEAEGKLPYVAPTAAAQAAGTAQGELPYAGPLAKAKAAGAAQGELPYVGPKAKAEAFGKTSGTNAANAQSGTGGQAAVINATAGPKANAAALAENAKNPALIKRAVETETQTAPIKTKEAIDTAAGTATAEFPFKLLESLASRAGTPLRLDKNERAVSGVEAFPPGMRDMITNIVSQLPGWRIVAAPGSGIGNPQPSSGVPTAPAGPGVSAASGAPPLPEEKPPAPATASPAAAAPAPSAAPPAAVSPPAVSPGATPAPHPVGPSAPPPAGIDPKLWSEIPTVAAPSTPLRGAGGSLQGVSSSQIDMENKANTEKEAIDNAGKAANGTLGQLATLKSTLASGQFNTNATAPLRATMSSYVNALTGDRGLAKSLTGIDPAQAEVFNKDSTRMGLQFARSTEGAREAVAAIKIALGANPSLSNTMEANRMIIGLMQRAAEYDVATQRASDAYYLKNGHNVAFSGWWNKNHPSTDFITGKADPYEVPVSPNGGIDQSMLIPGFTYKSPDGKVATWTGKGFQLAQ